MHQPADIGLPRGIKRTTLSAALAVLMSLLNSAPAVALDPHRALTQAYLRKWQFQQGLPQPTIFKVLQTADGYIWLGTQSGLYRFDGLQFKDAPAIGYVSFKNFWIQDVCEDRSHNLWIATSENGLVRLAAGKTRSFGVAAGLPSANVRCLLLARNGDLWIGTDNGLAHIAADKAFLKLPEEPKITPIAPEAARTDIHSLFEAFDEAIWTGGEGNRIGIWNGNTFSSRPLTSIPARGSVRAMVEAGDGSVWIGTSSGLVNVNPRFESRLETGQEAGRDTGQELGNERRLTHADGLPDDTIECLVRSRDGTIWAGTHDGFCRLQGDEIESFRTRDGLSQSTVFTIIEDHEGSIWAGTKHGLNQFVDRRTMPITMSEGLPGNDTGAVIQDQSGAVWIGTLGQGLARYDGRRCALAVDVAHGLPSGTILSLVAGDSGDLWIGTNRGLCRMHGGQIQDHFTTEQGLPSNIVSCLCRDERGVLWAGTAGGLAELQESRFVQPEGDADALELPILALVEYGAQGLVAAPAGGGIFRCIDRHLRADQTATQLSEEVNAFFKDRDGRLWMGTRGGGVVLWDGGKIDRFTVKDGLYDDEISGIVADEEDRLWMACSRGIFSVSRGELLKFAAGGIAKVTSNPFSPTDAQRTIACQPGVEPAVWKMQDGRIWFSTDHGVLVVDPAHTRRVLPPPTVVVEEVQVNGQEVNANRIGELPPGRTNLYFRFTALSFASPSRTTFRHQLEGFDKDWVEAGSRREAFYTNLPPGNYRFRVSAANQDGPWNEARRVVEFTLDPYFYQTQWFLPLVVGMLILTGWGVSRLRVLQVQARLNAVLAERSRIARELHDTLIQGFSGVTMQMQGLAARLGPAPERAVLDGIIDDAGHCLREARLSVGGLRSVPGNATGLADAVGRAARQLTETRDVRLSLKLEEQPPPLSDDVEYNLLRIAQEAITNAVKHAAAGSIEVSLECVPHKLVLTVRDDGVGFVVPGREQSTPGHYGLIGMRERANQINAELQLNSQPGLGTTVRLDLPLPLSNEASSSTTPTMVRSSADH